ncbi:MDS1 and EVI1 complex locus protein EVI1-like [Acanthaster planci]|uniref:MDS1 and EVI1 complex locus protein EVI1-like n=1 Tax=Acanthaster planci TaxID=133434 RepID=A0A8B7XMQ6_ACAPL|nr:MDS1 and EVI1 complex locus protein EVI1-like [Acanthaster planci]
MRQFKCQKCTKAFGHKRSLIRHDKDTHGKAQEGFPCPLCSTRVRRKDNLRRHCKKHHLTSNLDELMTSTSAPAIQGPEILPVTPEISGISSPPISGAFPPATPVSSGGNLLESADMQVQEYFTLLDEDSLDIGQLFQGEDSVISLPTDAPDLLQVPSSGSGAPTSPVPPAPKSLPLPLRPSGSIQDQECRHFSSSYKESLDEEHPSMAEDSLYSRSETPTSPVSPAPTSIPVRLPARSGGKPMAMLRLMNREIFDEKSLNGDNPDDAEQSSTRLVSEPQLAPAMSSGTLTPPISPASSPLPEKIITEEITKFYDEGLLRKVRRRRSIYEY